MTIDHPDLPAWNTARDHYWDTQRKFRYQTIALMETLAPARVSLYFTDDYPSRLTVAQSDAIPDDEELYHLLDEMAGAMEFADWEEAKSYFLRGDMGEFYIDPAGPTLSPDSH